MINFEPDRLFKIAFDVYDFNQDRLICELDTYTNMSNFQGKEDDDVFI